MQACSILSPSQGILDIGIPPVSPPVSPASSPHSRGSQTSAPPQYPPCPVSPASSPHPRGSQTPLSLFPGDPSPQHPPSTPSGDSLETSWLTVGVSEQVIGTGTEEAFAAGAGFAITTAGWERAGAGWMGWTWGRGEGQHPQSRGSPSSSATARLPAHQLHPCSGRRAATALLLLMMEVRQDGMER